jgi:hypothetical protein
VHATSHRLLRWSQPEPVVDAFRAELPRRKHWGAYLAQGMAQLHEPHAVAQLRMLVALH